MKTTSILAHESIKPEKDALHKKILSGLWKIGKGTSKEIAYASKLTDDQTRKRLSEMERKGWVSVSGTKRCTTTGRLCQIWELNYQK